MESSRPARASSGEDKLLDIGVGERGNDLRQIYSFIGHCWHGLIRPLHIVPLQTCKTATVRILH